MTQEEFDFRLYKSIKENFQLCVSENQGVIKVKLEMLVPRCISADYTFETVLETELIL